MRSRFRRGGTVAILAVGTVFLSGLAPSGFEMSDLSGRPTVSATAAPVADVVLSRAGWTAAASSAETAGENGSASNVLDGNPDTIWHSKYVPTVVAPPHQITLDMRTAAEVSGLRYQPRGTGVNGRIGAYAVSVSSDGQAFSQVTAGTWPDDAAVKTASFPARTARYIRLTASSEAGNRGGWATAGEINVLGQAPTTPPDPGSGGLLLVASHADDEGIFGGGVLPYYAQSGGGKPVTLLTMVSRNGDGTNPITSGSTSRMQELRNAIDVYAGRPVGSGTVRTVGGVEGYVSGAITHRQGGFIDTGCCEQDPNTSWVGWGSNSSVQAVTPGFGNTIGASSGRAAAARVIAREIRRAKPRVVATVHDMEGDYGHSNHTATSIATTEGYRLAADPSVAIDGLPAWQAQELYLRGRSEDNRFRGADPANGVIRWGDFTPTGGLNSLFFERSESPAIGGRSPRAIADAGVDQHVSQGSPDVSSVFRTGEYYAPHHSEWWTLYAATAGPEPTSTFTIPGDETGGNYTNWARGDFSTR